MDDKLSISQISRLHSNNRFSIKRYTSILIQDTDDANALQAWPKPTKSSSKGNAGIYMGQSHQQSNQLAENLSNQKKSSVDSAKSGPAFLPLEEIKEKVPGIKPIKKGQKGLAKSKSPGHVIFRKKNAGIKLQQIAQKRDLERNSKSPEIRDGPCGQPNGKVSRTKIHTVISKSKKDQQQNKIDDPNRGPPGALTHGENKPVTGSCLQIPGANDMNFQINLTNRIREINPKNLYMPQSKKSSTGESDSAILMPQLRSSNLVQTQSKAVAQANASGSLGSLGS